MGAPDVVGPAEVAQLLGVDRHKAYRVTKRPDFPEPGALCSGRRVWERADVEEWIREHWSEVRAPSGR